MDTSRGWLEIDLDAFTHNLSALRRRAGPGVALVLVAKADAYGHGAVPLCHHAVRAGIDAVGVSSAGEAAELRRAGLRTRLLVLGALPGAEAPLAVEHEVEVALPSLALAEELERAARRAGRRARVHLKLDTGMHRLGVSPEEGLALLERIRDSGWLELAGAMTHLASVEGARHPAGLSQMEVFRAWLAEARRRGLLAGRDVWIHAANSAALLSGGMPRFDAVRVGAAAYGIAPDPGLDTRELLPLMTLRSRVVHLLEVPEGADVGYAGTWTARRPSRLAVVPIGYGDGVDWRLSNKGSVLVRGQRAPIVGRVSMDFTTLDVTLVPGVGLGDPVTFFGRDGERGIRLEEVAGLIGTIPYELACSIGRRVERVYTGGAVAQESSRRRAALR